MTTATVLYSCCLKILFSFLSPNEVYMSSRIDYYKVSPEVVKAMIGLENFVNKSGLERSLLDLVKLRASQINGCAFCVDTHCADARKNGESERRLYAVAVWRETPFFTGR